MVQILFDPAETKLYIQPTQLGGEYYVGRVFQRGRGLGYQGRHHGAGLGDIFKSVWSFLKPMALGAAKNVGQEGMEAGARILSNLAQGADLKETVVKEGKAGIKKLLDKAGQNLQEGGSAGRKRKRHHPHKTEIILKPEDLIGKAVSKTAAIKKRNRQTTLGFY